MTQRYKSFESEGSRITEEFCCTNPFVPDNKDKMFTSRLSVLPTSVLRDRTSGLRVGCEDKLVGCLRSTYVPPSLLWYKSRKYLTEDHLGERRLVRVTESNDDGVNDVLRQTSR